MFDKPGRQMPESYISQLDLAEVLKTFETENIQIVLELGCGKGQNMKLLKEMGYDVVGVDEDERNVEYCRAYGLNVFHHDLSEPLPFENKAFDACISLHYLSKAQFFTALVEECVRVSSKVVAHVVPLGPGREQTRMWLFETPEGIPIPSGFGFAARKIPQTKSAIFYRIARFVEKQELGSEDGTWDTTYNEGAERRRARRLRRRLVSLTPLAKAGAVGNVPGPGRVPMKVKEEYPGRPSFLTLRYVSIDQTKPVTLEQSLEESSFAVNQIKALTSGDFEGALPVLDAIKFSLTGEREVGGNLSFAKATDDQVAEIMGLAGEVQTRLAYRDIETIHLYRPLQKSEQHTYIPGKDPGSILSSWTDNYVWLNEYCRENGLTWVEEDIPIYRIFIDGDFSEKISERPEEREYLVINAKLFPQATAPETESGKRLRKIPAFYNGNLSFEDLSDVTVEPVQEKMKEWRNAANMFMTAAFQHFPEAKDMRSKIGAAYSALFLDEGVDFSIANWSARDFAELAQVVTNTQARLRNTGLDYIPLFTTRLEAAAEMPLMYATKADLIKAAGHGFDTKRIIEYSVPISRVIADSETFEAAGVETEKPWMVMGAKLFASVYAPEGFEREFMDACSHDEWTRLEAVEKMKECNEGLKLLAQDSEVSVRTAVATVIDRGYLPNMMFDVNATVRAAVSERLPVQYLPSLINDSDIVVRSNIASRLPIGSRYLEVLAKDSHPVIRKQVAERISIDKLKIFAKDPSPEVMFVVVNRYPPDRIDELDTDNLLSMDRKIVQRREEKRFDFREIKDAYDYWKEKALYDSTKLSDDFKHILRRVDGDHVKAERVQPILDSFFPHEVHAIGRSQWLDSSSSEVAGLLKDSAARVLGGEVTWHNNLKPDEFQKQIYPLYETYPQQEVDKYVKNMYEFTQAMADVLFPDQETVTLYRGTTKAEAGDLEVGEAGIARCNSLSSWSTKPDRAAGFGDMLIKAEIPKTRFWTTYLMYSFSGFEGEIVVLGQNGLNVTCVSKRKEGRW